MVHSCSFFGRHSGALQSAGPTCDGVLKGLIQEGGDADGHRKVALPVAVLLQQGRPFSGSSMHSGCQTLSCTYAKQLSGWYSLQQHVPLMCAPLACTGSQTPRVERQSAGMTHPVVRPGVGDGAPQVQPLAVDLDGHRRDGDARVGDDQLEPVVLLHHKGVLQLGVPHIAGHPIPLDPPPPVTIDVLRMHMRIYS